MGSNPLADAMITIKNAELVGKRSCSVPKSNLIKNVMEAMQRHGYIEKIKINPRTISVLLTGKINNSRSIVPRYSCSYKDFEKFEKRYLPTKNIGIIILSTSKGVMSHREAKEGKVGGKLLAFVY